MSRDAKKVIFHKCYSMVMKRFYADYRGVCMKFPNTREEATFVCIFFLLDPAGDINIL